MSLRVAFFTLGCKVNTYETQSLKGKFEEEGFTVVDFKDSADAYVINTCTVTHVADRKSRQAARKAKRTNPHAFVVLTGCYPQAEPEAVSSLSEVDLLLGTRRRSDLPRLVKESLLQGEYRGNKVVSYNPGEEVEFEELPWVPERGRTRAFLKVQEGCNQYCSYCIVPVVRGPLRSLPLFKAVEYLHRIAANGYKEVVLTGIRLGAYGLDLAPPASLTFLLQEAVKVEGIERIRLSSIEPQDFTDDLLDIISSSDQICSHLHIPLQSGDDTILAEMGRSYDTSYYKHLIQKVREGKRDVAVSTDIIVGFPGEGKEHFNSSYNFVQECGFSRLHVFKYSPRPNTRASEMPGHVDAQTKEERSREMIELGGKLSEQFRSKFLNRSLSVLFEKKVDSRFEADLRNGGWEEEPDLWEGWTSNYLQVCAPADEYLRGQIKEVFIEKSRSGYLLGRLVPR